MNEIDQKILKILQENAKETYSTIAGKFGRATSGILERVRKLERKGIIRGYHAVVDPKIVGLNVLAFVFVTVKAKNWDVKMSEALSKIKWVQEVHKVVGQYSYLLKVRAYNNNHLSEVIENELGSIDSIQYTHTTMVLDSVKEGYVIPVEDVPNLK